MNQRLSDRDGEIFRILVADYIATADPIGSRTIAKQHPAHLSPATIRNVMSDLTEMGLIAQPHASAGRIPTDVGFRYYVDTLLKRRELTDAEMEAIREKCTGDEPGMGRVLHRASRMLAAVSRYVGLVATPGSERISFKRIEFVPLSHHRLLGILVSQDGQVENRLIETGEEFTYPELERISNYCNQFFVGLSFDEALTKIERELATERADYDRLLKKALLFSKEVLDTASGADVMIDGEVQLLGEPEFAEADKFKRLLEALEEKQKILQMLGRCREAEGVRIFIGADAGVDGIDALGVVGAPYLKDGRVVGTLGVIGPMRMDYSRVVPIVDFTAKVLGDALES